MNPVAPLQKNATAENPRNLSIVTGATYCREVAASLERVWENVHDWEHLPWLHSGSFGSIDLQVAAPWGWRAAITTANGAPSVIELVTDKANNRYVSRTLEGQLGGMEIWTDLTVLAPHRTGVQVRFDIPNLPEDQAAKIGRMLAETYVTLWDEDESMMMERQAALDADVVRVLSVDVDATPRQWDARCPHMLGPLDQGSIEDGCVTCPWHGYRFDLKTGESSDGYKLRLLPPPASSSPRSDERG